MGYSKYVGRVGALALALGIGTAVANPAWAEAPNSDTESTSTGSATAQTPSQPSAGSETTDAPQVESEAPIDDEEIPDELDEHAEIVDSVVDEPVEDLLEEDVAPTPSDISVPAPTETGEPPRETTPPEPENETEPGELPTTSEDTANQGADTVRTETPSAPMPLTQRRTTSTVTAAALTAAPPAGVPAPAPLVKQPTTPIGVLFGGPVAFLDIAAKAFTMLFNPGPSVPGDPPLLLGVLAFVRREIHRTFLNTSADAVGDVATTSQDAAVRITVLGNDVDPDIGDILTITDYTQSANGVVTLNTDGIFTYTPKAGFSGTDTFTYTVSDDASPWHVESLFSILRGTESATATVTITVTAIPGNGTPTATSDAVTTAEDTPIVIDVKANDTDPNGDSLTVASVSTPAHGTATIIAGKITYTPNANYHGTDTFAYTLTDGSLTAIGTVTVTVTPVDDSPLGATFTIDEQNTRTGVVSGSVNVVDPDGGALTFTLTGYADPRIGTVTIDSASGAWAFRPTPGARLHAWRTPGADPVSFEIAVSDGVSTTKVPVTVELDPAADYHVSIIDSHDTELSARGLTVDAGGRIYLTQYLANETTGQVVIVNPDGSVEAVIDISSAVPGVIGSAYDVAVGQDGRIYVSSEVADSWEDFENDYTESVRGAVLVIDPADDFNVTLFAETSEPAAGLAVDTAGRIYVSSWTSDDVIVLNTDGSVDAVLSGGDTSMALGSDGRRYVVDAAGVSVLGPDGTRIETFALPNKPSAVAVGANGVLYTTDFEAGTLTVLNPDGTVRRTFDLGTGSFPSDVAIGADGRIYVPIDGPADDFVGQIAVFTPVAVQPPAPFDIVDVDADTGAVSGRVHAVRLGGANTYTLIGALDPRIGTVVLDSSTGDFTFTPTSIARFEAWRSPGSDAVSFTIGTVDGANVTLISVEVPLDPAVDFVSSAISNAGSEAADVAVDSDGRLYVTNFGDGTVTVLNADGSVAATIDVGGRPYGVVVADDGRIYFSDHEGGSISVIDPADHSTSTFADLPSPARMALSKDGRLYVATANNGTVVVLDSDGAVVETFEVGGTPVGVAVADDGTFYVTDFADRTVKVFAADGTLTDTVDAAADAVAIGPNAVVYLADFAANSIRPLNADGSLGDPIFAGHNPTGIAFDGDGNLYVANFTGGTVTKMVPTAVSIANPATPIGNPVDGAPGASAGNVLGAPVVAPNGTIYQTGTYRDTEGIDWVTVGVTRPNGQTSVSAPIAGVPVGAVVLGPDGRAYQTVTAADAEDGTAASGVLVIEANGESSFTGYQAGKTAGSVVLDSDGTAYLTQYHEAADGTYVTTILVISGGETTLLRLDGLPNGANAGDGSGPVAAPDGTLYLTVTDWQAGLRAFDTTGYSTTLAVLHATGLTVYSIDGASGGQAIFGADGTVYQLLLSAAGDGATSSATTFVATLTAHGLLRLEESIAGVPVGKATVTADGSVYQTIVSLDPDSDNQEVTVAVITADGINQTGRRISGLPVDSTGAVTPVVVGSDGTVYQVARTLDLDTAVYRTLLAITSASGESTVIEIEGEITGPVVTGEAGAAFLTTHDSDTTWVTVIRPSGISTYAVDGSPAGTVVAGPDGAAYQTVGRIDPRTGRATTTVAVIMASGVTRFTTAGTPSGPVWVAENGAAYVSLNHGGAEETTTVSVITVAGLRQVISSVGGSAVGWTAGPDGALYLSVVKDTGNGSTTALYRMTLREDGLNLRGGIAPSQDEPQTTPVGIAGTAPTQPGTTPLNAGRPLTSAEAGVQARSLFNAAAHTEWTRLIDAAFLRPFLAADPHKRFLYTQMFAAMQGQTRSGVYLSDDVYRAQMHAAGVAYGHRNFSQNAQGRLVYTNRYSEDVMVVALPRMDGLDVSAVYVVRPGQSVTLPAAPRGNVAVAITDSFDLLGGSAHGYLSVAYIGASLTAPAKPGGLGTEVRPPAPKQPQIPQAKQPTQTKPAPRAVKKSDVDWGGTLGSAIRQAVDALDYFVDESIDDWADALHSSPAIAAQVRKVVPLISAVSSFWDGGSTLASGKKPLSSTLKLIAGTLESISFALMIFPPQAAVAKAAVFGLSQLVGGAVLVLGVTNPDL